MSNKINLKFYRFFCLFNILKKNFIEKNLNAGYAQVQGLEKHICTLKLYINSEIFFKVTSILNVNECLFYIMIVNIKNFVPFFILKYVN